MLRRTRRLILWAAAAVIVGQFSAAAPARADWRKYATILEALGRTEGSPQKFSSDLLPLAQSLDELEAALVDTGTDRREAEAAILIIVRNTVCRSDGRTGSCRSPGMSGRSSAPALRSQRRSWGGH